MYKSLKNALFFKSRRKSKGKFKDTVNNDACVEEPDIRQVIESSQCSGGGGGGGGEFTYLKVSEDVCRLADDHIDDDARCHQISAAGKLDSTVVDVHAVEDPSNSPHSLHDSRRMNVNKVKGPMSPKISSIAPSLSPDETKPPANPTAPATTTATATPSAAATAAASSSTTPSSSFESVADFLQHFSDLRTEVRIMMANESVIYLLGTNHADPQCPVDVASVIGKVKPQLVIIELCAWRACGCEVHRGNVFQTKPEFTFRYLRKVISQIGFLPAMIFFTDAFNEHHTVTGELLDYGGEFAVAARLCQQIGGCRILLGDREIPITVKRQASGMGNWRGIRISVLVTLALIFKRRMKSLLLRGHQLVVRDPRFYQIVVLERDIFLTYMLQVAAAMKYDVPRPQIVAVVGQGHLNGIQRFWGRILPQILPIILKPDLDF